MKWTEFFKDNNLNDNICKETNHQKILFSFKLKDFSISNKQLRDIDVSYMPS